MLRLLLLILVLLLVWMGDPVWAVGKPKAVTTPAPIAVELGTAEGELRFVPNQLTVQTGIPYRLHLSNPSPMKHYFTAKDFADAIWTRKVEVDGVEIKGQINNVELQPGSSLDWIFVPMLPGTYPVICTIAGHQESGMSGSLTIREP
ncbi:MAG: hypothetical protein OHK0012_04980 [Synechococcales cyanobacterium]